MEVDPLSAWILRHRHNRQYKRGAVWPPLRETGAQIVGIVIDGSLSAWIGRPENGLIDRRYFAGDLIGVEALFGGITRSMITRTRCLIGEVGVTRLREALAAEPDAAAVQLLTEAGRLVAENLAGTRRTVLRQIMPAKERVLALLRELKTEPEALSHPDGTLVHVSRGVIGQMTALTRETAGAVLQDLNREGRIAVRKGHHDIVVPA